MFGKKKQPSIKSLIAQGSCIEGNLKFTDGLRIDGEVIGDICANEGSSSILVISESAIVTGRIFADHVIINGRVMGPVHASELLELQPKAKIEGDVSYKALEMQNLCPSRQIYHPRLAGKRAVDGDFHLAVKLRRVFDRLNHQKLPFELRGRQQLGLQAANGHAVGATGWKQFFKKAEVVAQHQVV